MTPSYYHLLLFRLALYFHRRYHLAVVAWQSQPLAGHQMRQELQMLDLHALPIMGFLQHTPYFLKFPHSNLQSGLLEKLQGEERSLAKIQTLDSMYNPQTE